MGRRADVRMRSRAVLRLKRRLTASLAPGWSKVWVQFVEYEKRTPLVFTFFPEGHGSYQVEIFELKKPPLPKIRYDVEGKDEEKQERAFNQAFDRVMNFLEPKGYVIRQDEVTMDEIREYLGYNIDENTEEDED